MIQCKNCESAQWLHITASRIRFEDNGFLDEITECVECTLCGAEGKRDVWHEEDGTKRTSITGDIEETDEEPQVSP